MLLRACNRCGNLMGYGSSSYCSTCLPIVQGEREARLRESKRKGHRSYNRGRNPKYVRFYNSSEWRILSRKILQDQGYKCAWCGAIAEGVDHIREIKTDEGWERRLDPTNLRPLCHACHDKRHDRFKKRS